MHLDEGPAMESRLSLIPAMVQKLRFDLESRSQIEGLEAAFRIAISEALASSITRGNHKDLQRRVTFIAPLRLMLCRLGSGMKESASIQRGVLRQRMLLVKA